MSGNNLIFLENLEWFDETGQELVHRLPEEGSGEIKYGAQLTLRESQAGVFYYKGKAVGAFGPGRHTLKTGQHSAVDKNRQLALGHEKPAQSRSILRKSEDFHQSEMGHPGPGGVQRFRIGSYPPAGVWRI